MERRRGFEDEYEQGFRDGQEDLRMNQEAFDDVKTCLQNGEALTLEHVGAVFGEDFWMLLVYCLLDSQDAARAIQGALLRLSGRGGVDLGEEPKH